LIHGAHDLDHPHDLLLLLCRTERKPQITSRPSRERGMTSTLSANASARKWKRNWCEPPRHTDCRAACHHAPLGRCPRSIPSSRPRIALLQEAEEAEREAKKEEEAQKELDNWKHLFEVP
jgi:hypothetical protein